jgi:hypothetical protein
MERWALVAVILAGSCQPVAESGAGKKATETKANSSFVPKSPVVETPQNFVASEEGQVVSAASQEFFGSRWGEWSSGEFVAFEPSWGTGQFQSFDRALEFWTTKFGNDGNADEETLKRIRSTLDAAEAPPSPPQGNVAKGLDGMELDAHIVLTPSTMVNNSDVWVPGAVSVKNRAGQNGGIRVKGTLCYPLFSGNGHYAMLQMNRVKAGSAFGQLHFFLEKTSGSWRTLAVGRVAE